MYYAEGRYVDGSLAITTWTTENGYPEPYGNVTVNLSEYGLKPPEGYIFVPSYKMPEEYLTQVLSDIADDIVIPVPMGRATGLMVRLRDNWRQNVKIIEFM